MIYRFQSSPGEIKVRPYSSEDIPDHVSYLYDSPRNFLESIAFDVSQFPEREACLEHFSEELRKDKESGYLRRIVGELDRRTISIATFERPNDQERYAHFHVIDPILRGKGLGGVLLSIALQTFMVEHQVGDVFLEPKSSHESMNRLLSKLGFSLIDTTEKAAGAWALRVEVNRYRASRQQLDQNFKRFCELHGIVQE